MLKRKVETVKEEEQTRKCQHMNDAFTHKDVKEDNNEHEQMDKDEVEKFFDNLDVDELFFKEQYVIPFKKITEESKNVPKPIQYIYPYIPTCCNG